MAEMVRCEKCGSFFDLEKSNACPYCKNTTVSTGNAADLDKTEPVKTTPTSDVGTTSSAYSQRSATNDDGPTVAIWPVEELHCSTDPVVGWLVCLSGNEKGRDYRIHADNNFIGRDRKMDICISGDETISRDKHAVIAYDNRDRVFYFAPGDGRSIVRLNGKAVLSTTEIKAYDKIELGKTELLFVPLCGEGFDWADTKTEE